MRTLSWRTLCLSWVVVLVCVSTFPWVGGSPHWERVSWIPFADVVHSSRRLVDAVVNVLLYLPFGFSFAQTRSSSSKSGIILQAGLLALLLAGGCEFYQVFSSVRYPTATDLVTNTLGALLGASIGVRFHMKKFPLVFDQ